MIVGHPFALLFSNFVNITSTIPLSVSRIACGKVCIEETKCSSFFYNRETKACHASTQRYLSTTGLSPSQGYYYYIMGPDCGDDWTVIAGQCYLLRHFKTNWKDAWNKCEGLGGFLAKTDSLADNLIINTFVNYSTDNYGCMWIGGTDEAKEGTWVWGDGTKFSLNLWGPGLPDNARVWFKGDEDCLEQCLNHWQDLHCSKNRAYLCEK